MGHLRGSRAGLPCRGQCRRTEMVVSTSFPAAALGMRLPTTGCRYWLITHRKKEYPMKKLLIASALSLMCSTAFAQNTTGPAPQSNNMDKPGMNNTDKAGMKNGSMGKETTGTNNSTSKNGMSKDGMKKDDMKKKAPPLPAVSWAAPGAALFSRSSCRGTLRCSLD